MKNFKRVIAALLTVVMLFAMVPMAAIADDADDTPWIQLESVKDPETGKSTLTVKLNVDKIKKGKISGLELNEIFQAVLGDKSVPNSGLISMKDLLKIFPIIYEVDETGKAVASGDSVLDVVGATAIIGLSTIVEEYVNDLGALITAKKETLKNEIKIDNVLAEVSTNDTLRSILAGYFDTAAERDLYMTAAGKTALAGIAGKTKEQVFAELTTEDYKNFFNAGYLNFEAIVSGLMNDVLDALANSTYPNVSDYLTTTGLSYVETKKFDIVKYLLENDQVTIQELSEHLNITVDNVNNLFVDGVVQDDKTYNERTNLANEIIKALFGTTYIKTGKELALAEAIRAGSDLWALSAYLDLNALLETGFGYSKDDVMTKALDNTSGLVKADHSASILALIKDSTSTVESFVPHVDVEKMVDALGITKDQVKAKIGTPLNDPGIVTNWVAVLALGESAPVSEYLPYLNIAKLLAAIYGDDATAKNTVALQILTASSLVKEGSEAAVLTLVQSSTSKIEDFTDYIQVSSVLSALGITYVDIYEKLLDGSSVIKAGKADVAAAILDANKSNFGALVTAMMADDSPLVDNALVTLVQNFVTGIETGSDESRKKAFEKTIKAKIEESPTTYIKDDGVNALFGSKLIYYFFKHVDAATGKIDGQSVDYYLDLTKVVALLDVKLTAGSTLKAKIISVEGYETYLTAAGKAFVDSKVVEATEGKELEELYSNYTTYFDTDALFGALVLDTAFTNIVFNDPQKYVTVKGMNTILQAWLTEEGLDSKDMTDIIDTLKNADKKEYKTTNGEMVYYNGNKLLRNAVIQGISKFFTNAVDIVVDDKDIADTEPYPNRHLVLDGTALMERIYNCLLPTSKELDNIGSDGYLKTFNVVIRAQNDYYYWEEDSSSVKVPPQAENGDLEYITLDVDVKLYLTGDLTGLKKQVQQHKDKIKSDFDFEYLYDYTYGIYKDGGTMKILVAADTYLDLTYAELTTEQKMRANRYNKVGLVKGDDEIDFSLDLPYFLTFVYRNLAESSLDSKIKEKLYDFVYNKTISDLTSANRFTIAELYAMIDALDLDAVMEDFCNDPRGREWLMLLFDFIGDEDLIMDWYENGKPSTSVKDYAGNDSYYVDPDWTAANGWYVTAEWVWQALTHWKDLEQAAFSRGQDIKEIAALLDALQKNALFNKLLDRAGRDPIDFTTMVNDDFHLPVGDFLGDVTIALDTSAHTLEAAFKNPAKSFKDVLKAFVKDEYANIQKGLNRIFGKMPSSIIDSPIKDFYMGSSLFKTEPSDSSKNTYTTLNEYKLINKNLKTALGSAWSDLTEEEVAEVVDGFVGNLQSARLVNVSAKQNGLYKVNFYGLDGTTKLLTTFLPKETDPAKAYQDPEVKTGYVFSGWSLTLGGARIDETPSYDVDLYPIYTPDYTINYNLNVTFYDFDTGLVTTAVTAGLVGGATRHYNDAVTLALADITPSNYTLKKIEYSLDGGSTYTEGTSFNMPMKAVEVKAYMKNVTLTFDTQPEGITVYPSDIGDPIVITITKPGKEIDNVVYDGVTYTPDPNDGNKLKDSSGNELKAKDGVTSITVNLKDIDYKVTLGTVTANDSATVSATLVASVAGTPATVFHYGDKVTLDVTGIVPSDYTVNYVEYKADGDENYTLYNGKPIDMPADNLSVNVYLYAPVSFSAPDMSPAGTTATVNPTSVGEPIVITGITPGYEITTVLYDGVIYTVDPTDGKLKDPLGNELVAKSGASDIKVTLSPIHYNITVNYSVPSVTGDLVSMTDKTVEDTITLAVSALNTTAYKVSYITYRLADATAETVYSGPFKMLPGNLVVTVYLTETSVPTPSTPAYKIDDIEVTGDVVVGDDEVDATVSFDKPSYKPGDVVIVTVDDIEEGYELDYIAVVKDGEETPVDGTYFIMPDGKIGVKVYTKRKTYEYSIAGVPDSGLYKDTISFTVTVKEGEVMKEIPEGCVLVSAVVGPNGEMELTYVFSLTENGKDVNYRIGDLSYRTLKIRNGVEWVDANDPTGENGSAFKGWSALVGETYLFASFEKTAKLNLWWLWIILILLILITLEVIFYRKDEKDGRKKGGLWKVVRAIGDAFIALSKAFYGLFHRKKA